MRTYLAATALLALTTCSPEVEPAGPAYTYYADVEPILAANCVSCHKPGGAAPFALDSFQAAHDLAAGIAAATAARVMPPFNADNSGACHTFRDARWLTEQDIAVIGGWAAAGAPAGAGRDATPPPPEQRLASVDATLDPGAAYTPNENLSDDYRCFIVAAPSARDSYLEGFAVRPAHPQMSHHLILYALDGTAAEQAAASKDAADPGPGYTCFGGPGVAASMIGGWAPGSAVTRYPAGTGVPLAGGRQIVMQWHYNTASGVAPDRPQVGLQIAPHVAKPLRISQLADTSLFLMPGDVSAEAAATMPLALIPPGGVDVQGVFPHMHQLGRRIEVAVERGGERECLIDVDRWDFHWQQLFLYETPVHVEPGRGDVRLTCTYDTTSRDKAVSWGEGTQDEMCLAFFFYTL